MAGTDNMTAKQSLIQECFSLFEAEEELAAIAAARVGTLDEPTCLGYMALTSEQRKQTLRVLAGAAGAPAGAARAPAGARAGASTTPTVPGMPTHSQPCLLLHLTQEEYIRYHKFATEATSQPSNKASDTTSDKPETFAPSETSFERGKRAYSQIGWHLETMSYRQATSSRDTSSFIWRPDVREDDLMVRQQVLDELNKELPLPECAQWLDFNRKVIVVYGNHRIKITSKTDFVAVLKHAVRCLTESPQESLWAVICLLETKTKNAWDGSLNKARGNAMMEFMAVNLRLEELGVPLPAEGVAVILTDMNRFRRYSRTNDADLILELCYDNKAVAFDDLGPLLQKHAEFVSKRYMQRYQAVVITGNNGAGGGMGGGGSDSAAHGGLGDGGADGTAPCAGGHGSLPTTTAQGPSGKSSAQIGSSVGALLGSRLEADIMDAARDLAADAGLPLASSPRVKVYVEGLGSALARAMRTGQSSDQGKQEMQLKGHIEDLMDLSEYLQVTPGLSDV
jgi:hypothetical protein